jgi:hypothetical protein
MDRPNGLSRLWLTGLLLIAFPVLVRGAERRQPLIQLQGNEFLCTRSEDLPFGPVVCVAGTLRERTISIFRNTRAMAVTTEDAYDRDLPASTSPASSTIRDGFLTSRQVQQLNDFLAGISIANRRGGCNPFRGAPGFKAASTARYTIFWYSPDGRRTTVPFGNDFPRLCPPEILELFNTVIGLGESIR